MMTFFHHQSFLISATLPRYRLRDKIITNPYFSVYVLAETSCIHLTIITL